jgi:hypothetical protein
MNMPGTDETGSIIIARLEVLFIGAPHPWERSMILYLEHLEIHLFDPIFNEGACLQQKCS